MNDDQMPVQGGRQQGHLPQNRPVHDIHPSYGAQTPPQPAIHQPQAAHPGPPGNPAVPPHPGHTSKLPPRKGPKKWWHDFQRLPKKQRIIIISAAVGLLITSGLLWWFVFRSKPEPPPPPPVVKVEEPPKPTTVASPLTGVQVKPDLAKLPVTGIMIENSPDARPQSGLYDAGVVFEAIAEGGITRFLTLFQEARPTYVGPVRSVRPYYLDFLAPFDAPIAHAGGSGQALAELRAEGFKDLEAFQNPNYYQRIPSRYAPHNLYTNRASLIKLQASKGWKSSKFTGFTRKEKETEKKDRKTPNARTIDFSISSALYNPGFSYDVKSNSYLRSLGGQPHIDEAAKKRINPKVVIGLVMSHGYAGIYSVYGTKGSGRAFIFQDGRVLVGKWHKAGRKSQFKFTDDKNKTFELNPGKTWISIISSPGAVTYKP